MAGVLIRGISPKVLDRLKQRASRNGRSLQMEAKLILEHSAGETGLEEFRKAALKMRKTLSKRCHSDSAQLIRQDRLR